MGKLKKLLCCSWCRSKCDDVYDISLTESFMLRDVKTPSATKGQVLSVCQPTALRDGHVDSMIDPNAFSPAFCSTKIETPQVRFTLDTDHSTTDTTVNTNEVDTMKPTSNLPDTAADEENFVHEDYMYNTDTTAFVTCHEEFAPHVLKSRHLPNIRTLSISAVQLDKLCRLSGSIESIRF